MKKFSPISTALISSGVYSSYHIVALALPSQTLRFTTTPYDLVVGGVTYLADNQLRSMDQPRLSDAVDRELFKLSFVDHQFTFGPLAAQMLKSRVSVYGGLFNTTGEVLVDSSSQNIQPGKPINNLADMFCLYRGFADSVGYTISEEDGAIFHIDCAAPVANLDALRSFYTTQDSLRQRVSVADWTAAPDTAFDNIAIGGNTKEILWGKI